MSLEETDTANPREGAEAVPGFGETLYNEDGHLRTDFTEAVRAAVADGERDAVIELIDPLHESELGDLLEALTAEERQGLVRIAGEDFDFSSLTEVDEAIRLDIVGSLPNAAIAEAIQDLDSDDAIYILEDMEKADQEEVLDRLPFDDRILLRRALEYPEESAGRRMQTEFIAVPPFWTVGQTIDYMREEEDLPNRFHEIFVISPQYELLGYVQLDRLLRTGRSAKIESIKEESIYPIDANLDQEEAAHIFQRYDLLSAAVVDNGGRLVGVMTIDDIVDVIHEGPEGVIKGA